MKKTDNMSVFFISYAADIYSSGSCFGKGVKRLGLRHSDDERLQCRIQRIGAAQAQGGSTVTAACGRRREQESQ